MGWLALDVLGYPVSHLFPAVASVYMSSTQIDARTGQGISPMFVLDFRPAVPRPCTDTLLPIAEDEGI
jgi:hypothetical protein